MSSSLGDLVYRLATRVLSGPIADRVLPGRRREFREVGVTSVADARCRLLIGPVNSAGQGYAWAMAAQRLPDVKAVNLTYRGADEVFGFPASHVIPVSALLANARWRKAQRTAVLRRFTHIILESGRSVLGRGDDVIDDIRAMRAAGVQVALLWHGSDIRTPSLHAEREPESPFRGGMYADTELLEQITRAHHDLVAQASVPVFVSTPDLLADIPEATWLPVVVDPERWASASTAPALQRGRPLVVHAPSRAGLKGSALIADTVRQLHDEGVIEYREAEGVPAVDMPALYGAADIVLDQFAVGSYGVAACEAMAAGRLVVSHVSEAVRARVHRETGETLPIVEARAGELEDVLRDIARNRARFAATALAGAEFVRAVHDGTRTAEALRPFLRADPPPMAAGLMRDGV